MNDLDKMMERYTDCSVFHRRLVFTYHWRRTKSKPKFLSIAHLERDASLRRRIKQSMAVFK